MTHTIGPFEIVRELGRGGMGAVFEAVHPETGSHYAVKVILQGEGLLDANTLLRFRREAELSARLDHPHIAKIHTADLTARPRYLVQELLSGGCLRDRIQREGRIDPQQARALTIKLARAVAHAHQHGVLHRDLKPQNVLLDERGEPKITDFGLARSLVDHKRLTLSGEVLGTPSYMAPEQATDGARADPRADVYGLGAILYCMLTGQPPLTGATSFLDAMDRLQRLDPPPIRSLAPDVPPDLVATCERALAKLPDERFQTAADLAHALETPTLPPPKQRLPLALAAAAALALGILGATLAASPADDDPEPTATATSPEPPPSEPVATSPTRFLPVWIPRQGLEFQVAHTWGTHEGTREAALTIFFSCRAQSVTDEGLTLLLRPLRARVVGGYERNWEAVDTNTHARHTDHAQLQRVLRWACGEHWTLTASFNDGVAVDCPLWTELTELLTHDSLPPWSHALARAIDPSGPAWSTWWTGPVTPHPLEPNKAFASLEHPPGTSVSVREHTYSSVCALPLVEAPRWQDSDGDWRPLHQLGRLHPPSASILTATNAFEKIRFQPDRDIVAVPWPDLLANVLPDLSASPSRYANASETPTPLRPWSNALVHAWPWGMPIAFAPGQAAYLPVGEPVLGWQALAWGGGLAFSRSEDWSPEPTPLVEIITRSDPLYVFPWNYDVSKGRGESNGLGLIEKSAWVAWAGDIRGNDSTVWFDERKGFLQRERDRFIPDPNRRNQWPWHDLHD